MAVKFVFEELDDATRGYLLTARTREGRGMPGIFVRRTNGLPLVGCIVGPIIIAVILGITLTPDQIYNDPGGLAFLQTAGILVGGWMVFAALRIWLFRNSRSRAGYWLYADPLFLYEANAEQIAVTPMSNVTEATCVHNLNNNAYANSQITFKFEGSPSRTIVVNDQRRADAIVSFYNFLAWSRGPEGFGANAPQPALLGGLAKYVSKNDAMPLDAEGAVDLNAIELEVDVIPTEPQRAGSARPNILIYLFLIAAGVLCYLFMRELDVPIRDAAVYKLVTTDPVQPIFLRQYLADDRNQLHRNEVYQKLATFYDRPVKQAESAIHDRELKEGMIQLLESLRKADQPVVAIRVVEQTSPPGAEAGKEERVVKLRDLFVRQVTDTLTEVAKVPEPVFIDPAAPRPPKLGEQLINFVEASTEMTPHMEIRYIFVPEPGLAGQYHMKATVTLRDDLQGAKSWKSDVHFTQSFEMPLNTEEWADQFAKDLSRALIGVAPKAVLNLD